MRGPARLLGTLLAVVLVASACSGSEARARGSADVLRLGVFPTLTHAPAHVGIGAGIFAEMLAPTEVQVRVFNSGADAGVALLSGSIDASYMGPWPPCRFSCGQDAVVSAAVGAPRSSRGAMPIDGPEDLHGKRSRSQRGEYAGRRALDLARSRTGGVTRWGRRDHGGRRRMALELFRADRLDSGCPSA
jgi:ABC-type nitrate/sulfonate/bicarbonate transport system substrate-binding protein